MAATYRIFGAEMSPCSSRRAAIFAVKAFRINGFCVMPA